MLAFEKAGDWYIAEDNPVYASPFRSHIKAGTTLMSARDMTNSSANGCYRDMADLAAELDQFDKAIEKYQLVRHR